MPALLDQKSGQRTGKTSGQKSASTPAPKVHQIPFCLCYRFSIRQENEIRYINSTALNSRWSSLSDMILTKARSIAIMSIC